MNLTNTEMAHECMQSANSATRVNTEHSAIVDALAAQTYATLALIDSLDAKTTLPFDQRVDGTFRDVDSDDAIMGYYVGTSAQDAYKDYVQGGGFKFTPGGYRAALEAAEAESADDPFSDYQVYLFAVTVVQP